MTKQTPHVRRLAPAAAAVAALALAAGPAAAQGTQPDVRWRAWTGCWAPGSDSATPVAENAPTVCVVPTDDPAAVELVAVGGDRVVARERVIASGAPVAVERDGCAGSETATWSADGRRLFRESALTCANGVRRSSSGVFAIAPTGEWLDVRGIGAGASSGIVAVRFRPAATPAALTADLAPRLPAPGLAVDERALAAGPMSPDDVAEAAKRLEAAVVAALLVERGQPFALDGKRLLALADAGVPRRVIDAMVAVSYPRVFAVNRATGAGERREPGIANAAETAAVTGRTIPVFMDPFGWSPYGYGYGDPYGYGYGYGSRFSPYGLGYGYGSRFSPYGTGFGYYGTGPVIVVRQPTDGGSQGHGRVVRGRGYQSPGSGGGSTPRTSTGSGGTRSSDGGSSAGSGSSSGSDGGSSGRTAKPRVP